MIGTKSHWLFNLSEISNAVNPKYYLYTITISNALEMNNMSHPKFLK
jgi:hypothetical protein